MGISSSKLSKERLMEYSDLTYFGEGEIISIYKKFESVHPEEISKKPFKTRITARQLSRLPEFKRNPFLHRLCAVFSTSGDDTLSFEDFLDMMNCLSDDAPFSLKSEYAFRVFDFNENSAIDPQDMREVVKCITNRADGMGSEKVTKELIKSILKEADLDRDNQLGKQEFQHVLSKSPDFMNSFTIRRI